MSHPLSIKKQFLFLMWFASLMAIHLSSQALPAFARQTGQNCLACHAGGQYPELTPYGRMFKLTGYTIGERANPLSAMAVFGASKVKSPDDPNLALNTPTRNNQFQFETASLFLAGKITDNIGAFSQVTFDHYSSRDSGGYVGHTAADGIDIRYADQLVDVDNHLVYGVSLNNRPSIVDPWNTSWAWMQYVPSSTSLGSNQTIDGGSSGPPYPGNGMAADNLAGVNGYVFLNRSIYAELGLYRTASSGLRWLNAGHPQINSTLRGVNPYWRLAYSKEWGAQNLMVGLSGMTSHQYDSADLGLNRGDASYYQTSKVKGFDAQYQYLLDPHTVTLQFAQQRQDYIAGLNYSTPGTNLNLARAKASYVYQARYGTSLAYFNQPGDVTMATRGSTFEVFYMPLQYVRLGLQFTDYSRFAGLTTPSNANSVRFYVWTAY